MNDKILLREKDLTTIVAKQSRLREYHESGLSAAEFAASRGIHRSTLYRDIERASRGYIGFRDGRFKCKGQSKPLEDHMVQWVLAYLADHTRAKVAAIHRALVTKCELAGWGVAPSYERVLRFITNIAPDVRLAIEQGSRERIEQLGLSVQRTVDLPLSLVQLDFSELPVWTFLPNDPTLNLFKPWVVTAIDACTRVVLAAMVIPRTPSRVEILQTIKLAILPKKSDSQPFYGLFQTLSLDNHQAYKGDVVASLLRMGSTPLFIPPRSPEANGKVERYYQTLAGLFQQLAGYADRHGGLAKAKKSSIPYPLLQGLVDRFVLDYHLRVHSELNTTPWERWHDLLPSVQSGLIFDVNEINKSITYTEDRIISPRGVEVGGKRFIAPVLEGLVGKTAQVQIPPEGPGTFLDAYVDGRFVGELTCQMSQELAENIRTTRLERTIAIEQLRKTLLNQAPALLPQHGAVTPPVPVADAATEPAVPQPEAELPPAAEPSPMEILDLNPPAE